MTIKLPVLEADVRAARITARQQSDRIKQLETKINLVQRGLASLPTVGASGIRNYLRNGDFSHSWYTHESTGAVGDQQFECWEVYQHAAPSVGQQLKEDSVFSGVAVGSSTALADTGRSDTPTTDPNWDRTTGHARLGSLRSIDFPLTFNVVYPGRVYYVGFIAAKTSANVTVPGRLTMSVWDNTSGQRKVISGDGFALTAEVIGVPASRTSREYLVVLTSDFRETVKSATVTVANAPDDSSFVSGQVYVRLTWPRFAGFIQADIYRKTAGVYVLLSRQAVVTQYFDQGTTQETVGAYPDTNDTEQRASVSTQSGLLDSAPIDGVDPSWQQYAFGIQAPATYQAANTTDKQWLRIYFDEALTGTDAAHGMLIDLVSFSPDVGNFAHAPDDEKGFRNPVAAPNGSTQGGGGTGGGGFEPPTPGGGDCISLNSFVGMVDGQLKHHVIEGNVLLKTWKERSFLSMEERNLTVGKASHVEMKYCDELLEVRTAFGIRLRCSPEHRLITWFGDQSGTPVNKMEKDDPVISFDPKKNRLFRDRVVSIRRVNKVKQKKFAIVKISMSLKSQPFYFAATGGPGMISCHNKKVLPDSGSIS